MFKFRVLFRLVRRGRRPVTAGTRTVSGALAGPGRAACAFFKFKLKPQARSRRRARTEPRGFKFAGERLRRVSADDASSESLAAVLMVTARTSDRIRVSDSLSQCRAAT